MHIDYESCVLDNGLKVLVHKDTSTPIVAFNLLYDVGSKDEDPNKTGFAHLFEHLMFSGSKHVKDFDEELEKVGGENNAFTNNDFTNYYISIPKDNLETAFRLESDRMLSLSITEKKLKVQKGVVSEEFKELYLNQPYGDASLIMRPLCYVRHPYAWSTIGKDISHIESINLEDVKNFYHTYYRPDNAILVVAGDVEALDIFERSQKWFGGIPRGNRPLRKLPVEPIQTQARHACVYREVPSDAIYKAYHIGARMEEDFYTFDLISDVFSNGKSSRFYVELVKNQRLFNDLNAYVSADIDPGTFVISGNLQEGVSFQRAEEGIFKEIDKLQTKGTEDHELQKVKNKLETSLLFSNMKALDKAMNLAYFELMGGAQQLNLEDDKYWKVSSEKIKNATKTFLQEENCSTLYYHAKKTEN